MEGWDERSARAVLAAIDGSTDDGLVVLEPVRAGGAVVALRVTLANAVVRRVVGADPGGRDLRQVWPTLDDARIERLAAVLASGEPWRVEGDTWPVGPGGALRHVDLQASAFEDRLVLHLRDVGRHDDGEPQLAPGEVGPRRRLDGLGAVAGGVAHDVGNLITVILAACDLAETARSREETWEAITEVRTAAEQGAALVRRLLTFAQQEPSDPEELQVEQAIAELGPLLEGVLPAEIELAVDLGPDLPALLVDRPALDQALLNLVVNARDAMPGGGRITLELRRVDPEAAELDEAATPGAGEQVRIRVSDEGHGMTPEVAARAFEPFFSTKPGAAGSGLGLATVYGAVRRAGGAVHLDTGPTGTVVTLHLPAYAGRARTVDRQTRSSEA